EGLPVGGSAEVTMILHSGVAVDTYVKRREVPFKSFQEFRYNGITGAVFNGNTITLAFVDGDPNSDDGPTDGRIVDPSGPAMFDFDEPAEPVPLGTTTIVGALLLLALTGGWHARRNPIL